MTKDDLIKQDLNFLEYPLWMLDERVQSGVFTWQDREGFTYEARFKPPTKPDMLFLYYWLFKSQSSKWCDRVSFTKYELLKGCNIAPNKQWYERVDESLKRWEFTRLSFAGTFFDNKEYKTLHFGIIDAWGIDEASQKLWVRFNEEWLLKIQNSKFFKMMNFSTMKKLRSPLAVRLYEILLKNFQGRKVWSIDALKLATKIPLKEKYPSHIEKVIVPAVNRINKHADFQINVTVENQERGKSLFVFEKVEKTKPFQPTFPLEFEKPEDVGFNALLEFLPPHRKDHKTLWVLIKSYYEKCGFDYVARNISYANAKARVNYRRFLSDSLKKDWGLSMAEDEAVRKEQEAETKKKADEAAQKARAEKAKMEIEQENANRAKVYLSSLTPEALKHLEEEAFNSLDKNNQDLVKRKSGVADIVMKIAKYKIALERMKVS